MPLAPAKKARLSRALQRIARKVNMMLTQETGEEIGFSLIIWGSFGEDNMIQYVSNVNREDCILHLAELLNSWKSDMPDIPYHERQ
jgi:hypothetical protein